VEQNLRHGLTTECRRYTHNSGTGGYWAVGRVSGSNPDWDMRIGNDKSANRK
jgi:hypothetical protein